MVDHVIKLQGTTRPKSGALAAATRDLIASSCPDAKANADSVMIQYDDQNVVYVWTGTAWEVQK